MLRWSAPASAQGATASLGGQVSDATGSALPGAAVVARNADTGLVRSVASGVTGRYLLTGLPPGLYHLSVELSGFTNRRLELRLTVGEEAQLNVSLELQKLQEAVRVEASLPVTTPTQSAVKTIVVQEQIDELPISGRDFQQLAVLSPQARTGNVSPDGNFDVTKSRIGAISVAGGQGRYVNISIDGGDTNDDFVGGQTIQISQEAIQEFEVITQSYSAQYGRASDGIINVVTKSGTNDWHGAGFFYFRDRSLNSSTAIEQRLGLEKADFQRKQYGGFVGGPIATDRMHFLGSFERQSEDETRVFNSNGVFRELEGSFPTPFTQNLYFARFDAVLNNRMNVTVRYARENNRRDNDLAGGSVALESAAVQTNDYDSVLLAHTWTIGAQVVNDSRVQYSRFEGAIRSKLDVNQFPTLVFPDAEFGHNPSATQLNVQDKIHLRDDLTWFRGKHDLRFGFEGVFNLKLGIQGDFARNIFTFANNDYEPATRAIGPTNRIVAFESFSAPNVDILNDPPLKYLAGYAQDSWHVTSGLTLNLGVRYDVLLNLFPSRDTLDTRLLYPVFGQPKDDRNNFGPRVGLAYSPGGNGRAVLRGAFGVIYNYQAATGSTLFEELNVLPNPYALVLAFPNPDGSFPFGPNNIPSTFPIEITIGQSNPPGQKNPYSYHTTAGVSYLLDPVSAFAVDVDYVHTTTRNLPRQRDLNPRGPDGVRVLTPALPNRRFLAFVNEGESSYQGVSFTLRRRVRDNYQFQASYTLSDAETNVRDFFDVPLNSFEPDADPGEEGPSDFNERHRLVLSGIVRLPAGFQVSGILQAASARPWTRRGAGDVNGDGITGRGVTGLRGDRKSTV